MTFVVWHMSRATLGAMVAPPGVEDVGALAEAVTTGALEGLWWPDHWMGWAPNAAWSEMGAIAESWASPDLYSDPFVEMVHLGLATGARLLGTAVTDVVRRHPVGLLQTVETVLRALPEAHVALGIGCVPLVVLDHDLQRTQISTSLAMRALALSWSPATYRKVGEVHPLGDAFDPLGDLIPAHFSATEARELVEAVAPSVVEEMVVCGDVDLIADRLREFTDAGVQHVVGWELGYLVQPARRARGLSLMVESWRRAVAPTTR